MTADGKTRVDRPGPALGGGLASLGPDLAGAIVSAHVIHPSKRGDVKQLARRRYTIYSDWREGEGREIV